MKYVLAAFVALFFSSVASAQDAPTPFSITVNGIADNAPIPADNAYCIATETEKSSMTGKNTSPAITWTKGPEGTKSYALVMVDPDVPTDFTDAGKEGKTLAASMPRQKFYHWTVVNIPADVTEIKEGQGKSLALGKMAVSDYPKFLGLPNTPENTQKYRGYDGPCPPWNDEIIHRYRFKIFALDVDLLPLTEPFSGADAVAAIQPHILGKALVTGTYTLNPNLKK